MKNIKIIVAVAILMALIIGIIVMFSEKNSAQNEKKEDITDVNIETTIVNNSNDNINIELRENEGTMNSMVKIVINNKKYNVEFEDNETAKKFLDLLPKEFNMLELNGNEKYFYLDSILPTNSYCPNNIVAGDIMLYGNNCLVVFYKSFTTKYNYTKIGHIENIEDLGKEDINIKFEVEKVN